MVRVFLAIDLPSSLKKELSKLQTEEQAFARLKWVEEENFHLTLFFFGNLPEKEVDKLIRVCEKRLKEFPRFELFLTEVSGFPKKGDFRVVFLGCEEKSNTLERLVHELSKDFKKKGFKLEDMDFHPHITLFRLKKLKDRSAYHDFLQELTKKAQFLKGKSFPVRELILFESKLSPTGPNTRPLRYFLFKEISL
jgi:2'-5' RNA ligase